MKWSLAWLAMVSALSGCSQTTANRYDPFSIYGPRVIPPPATGTLGQPPGAYYQGPTAPATSAPLGAGQQLLPVPSLGSQSRSTPAELPRASGNWVPIHTELADSPAPAPRTSEVVQAGGSARASENLPWRIPDSARGRVQRAGAVEPIAAPYRPRPPEALSPRDMTEITELPRPIRPRLKGIPSAAVFPPLPPPASIEPVIYDQPVYDYGVVNPAIYGDAAIATGDAYSYPAMIPSNQPMAHGDQPASYNGRVVSTSLRSDAWKQRR